MSRLQVGVLRYVSVATAIAKTLGIEPPPDIRIGHGRITMTFRSLGASRWSENQQMDLALRAAGTARAVLAHDPRRAVRERKTRAIVVVYDDSSIVRGCVVVARWECVVPVPASHGG